MDAIQPPVNEPTSALSRLFGLIKPAQGTSEREYPTDTPRYQPSAGMDSRAGLLSCINSFLLDNSLAITGSNLGIAQRIFSGSDQKLKREISSRKKSTSPITQDWLDEVASSSSTLDASLEYYRMVDWIERNLESYAKYTNDTYCSSATYSAQLARHASELGDIDSSSISDSHRMIADLARLTKTMLDRTRKVEEQMRQADSEADKLRRRLEAARLEAEVDHLTKLPNRRAFENILSKLNAQAREASEPLSIAFCDIDHFKRVNDEHGHGTGDRVLKAVAVALASISGETCHVARHGGEEFVMLFVNQTSEVAKEQLDKIRERMALRKFVNRATDQPIGRITFSAGISDVTAFDDPRDALAAADATLYKAKDSGRNCILVAQ